MSVIVNDMKLRLNFAHFLSDPLPANQYTAKELNLKTDVDVGGQGKKKKSREYSFLIIVAHYILISAVVYEPILQEEVRSV